MGIYIKNVNMPAEGNETIIRIQPNGVILDQYGHHLLQKAVYVPPHGDLIEESKVLDIVSAWCPDDDGSVGKVGDLREILDEIEALPTIVSADKEGG